MMGYLILAAFFLTWMHCTAFEYCSDTDMPTRCVPCGRQKYKCPRQCGNERNLHLCDQVCSQQCVNSECEYDNKGTLRCLRGCTGFYTGPYCQQLCMEGCVKCTQDGKRCLECEQGLYGPTCSRKCVNCKNGKCNITLGTCSSGCEPGYFGRKCEKSCHGCRGCADSTSNCEVCDKSDGTCKLGCNYGFYGSKCDQMCEQDCTQCDPLTGICIQCAVGKFGKNCSQDCQHCKNNLCSLDSGQCTEGCDEGFRLQGTTCLKQEANSEETPTGKEKKEEEKMPMKKGEEEEEEKEAARESIFEAVADRKESSNRDYLLPAIICLLVFCAGAAVVGLCRLMRSRKGQRKAYGLHTVPDILKTPSAPVYDEVAEVKTVQQKQTLLDPERPPRPLPTERPYLSDLTIPPFQSMHYMTPVDEVPTQGNGFDETSGGTFSFEPQACSELNDDNVASNWKVSKMSVGDASNQWNCTFDDDTKTDLVFENEPAPSSFHKHELKAESSTPKGGQEHTNGGYEIPVEYLDTSQSGRSTPRYLEMCSNAGRKADAQIPNDSVAARRVVSGDALKKALLQPIPRLNEPIPKWVEPQDR